MRNILSFTVLAFIFALKAAPCLSVENYYQVGYKYGKTIGLELGAEEANRSVIEEHKEPVPLNNYSWSALLQEATEKRFVSILLKEVGINAKSFDEASANEKQSIKEAVKNIKNAQEKEQIVAQKQKLFIQKLEAVVDRCMKLLKNDAFSNGFADGLAHGYRSRTKDALYNEIKYKFRPSDWDQGYLDGHDRGREVGRRDKWRGNPSNWLDRYFETIFRPHKSNDAQYLAGFRQGFETGYAKGHKEALAR